LKESLETKEGRKSMTGIYAVSASPHLHHPVSVKQVMWNVVIALIPALVVATVLFGYRALTLTIYGVIAAVLTEAIIQKLRKKEVTISDGSAVITGMLIAFNLHAAAPWWLPVAGSVFAIAIGKHVFGGLGHNPFNPALLGRVFVVASWPTLTTAGWPRNVFGALSGISSNLDNIPAVTNLVTSATPLAVVKSLRDPVFVESIKEVMPRAPQILMGEVADINTLQNVFWGNIGGCIGEVSAAALLLGAVLLAWKRIIEWRIPVCYIGTVFVLTFIFGGIDGIFSASILLPFFHIFAGGVILGAFYMATDMVTSPLTKKGRIYYGIGCGLITVVIRLYGGYPEGVTFAILLMNLIVPLIDRYTLPRAFGAFARKTS